MSRGTHEPNVGATSDWFTPPRRSSQRSASSSTWIPASPGPGRWVPARRNFTKADDGLTQPWHGLVFMNPPFGARHGHIPWLRRFFDHGNGVGICRAYTSSGWFHEEVAPRAETLVFPRGKTKFVRPDGSIGTASGHGVVLLGMGETANSALERASRSGWGLFIRLSGAALPATARCIVSREKDLLSPLEECVP